MTIFGLMLMASPALSFFSTLFGNGEMDEEALTPAMLPQFDPPLKKAIVATYGVHPSKLLSFEGSSFTCGNGAVIPMSSVNDDFCDCDTGDDEPGTGK